MAFVSLPHPLTPRSSEPSSPSPPTPLTPPTDADDYATRKKYTLIFLASLGTTLLVTGMTGRKGMQKVKNLKAEPSPPSSPIVSTSLRERPQPPSSLRTATPRTSSSPSTSTLLRPTKPPKHLKHWYLLPTSSTSPAVPLPPPTPDFFAPNSHLLSSSSQFATAIDKADKLHEDGPEQPEPEEGDGFNGALYAAKALGIATAIVGVSAAVGVLGLMKWLEVDDMQSLALALRQTLSPKIQERRPNLPSWASPAPSEAEEEVKEVRKREDREVDEEATSYWSEVKETLDKEAVEEVRERERRWRALRGLPEEEETEVVKATVDEAKTETEKETRSWLEWTKSWWR